MKHFVCTACGNLVAAVNYSNKPLSCCERKMEELTPKPDANRERHTPHLSVRDNRVSVRIGTKDAPHPQTEAHRVDWVCLVTDRGSQRRVIDDKDSTTAHFLLLEGERPLRAFAYCNLHGLWVGESEGQDK